MGGDGRSTDPGAPAVIATGDLAAGTVVAGRYEIRGRLGAGAMGAVYRVHDRDLGEEVALKMLSPELLDDPGALERFRGEVKLARRIAHPNVCRVFDVGEDGPRRFLTMELVEGEDLRACLERGAPSQEDRVRLLTGVLAGLAAAHAAGIVHRDLKPENVLVSKEGRAIVADFGLARSWMGKPRVTAIRGTPAYMSPEQLRGQPLSPRSDVFAAGILAAELLSGRPPFGAGTAAAVTTAILDEAPSLAVADRVGRVLRRALAKDPAERFADAGELGKALAAAWAAPRRRWWLVAAAAALVLAASAWWLSGH